MLNEAKDVDMKAIYEQTFKDIKEGEITKGKIIAINNKDVLVDVGFKSEGVISLEEFRQDEREVGKEIDVYVESTEDENGVITLSRDKAMKLKGWDTIMKNTKEGDYLTAKVIKKVKGGYIIDCMGIEGFLPASLSMFKNVPDREVLSHEFQFKLLKVNYARKSLIVSRKEAVMKQKEEIKEKLWQLVKLGEVKSGLVKAITDFGAFIDLGGIDGLLHITDMSWSKINHPSEIVAIGDKIEVMVLNVDPKGQKISLGLKQQQPDPWKDIENKYKIGSNIKGKVVNIVNYGVFVELEKGIEGLVHVSEISWLRKVNHPQEMFAVGDAVEAQILNIEKDNRRIALSIKRLESNPWTDIENKYPVNSKVNGKIRGFTDYGAFVELDSNLEGMIHVSDISWTKRVAKPEDVLKKGQKIESVVLSVDAANQKISLGLKQLEENPWSKIAEKYPVDTSLEVEVVSITEFGVFVKIEDGIEGLIYSSEIEKEQMSAFKPGDKINAKIIKVDIEQAKIGLSAK
ncbi:MAG: 30S ribosomal protein S1 [Candidatus Gygaella obscura]|nr:30S ribosomal protein S1 [Candidatus Gygaella obscura]